MAPTMTTTLGDVGAFVAGPRLCIDGSGAGPLAGLAFAVKDLIDVAGSVTGCGNPDWRRSHAPALRTAPTVEALLAAGASLLGKTVTDELAFSLEGANCVSAPNRDPNRLRFNTLIR
jgi:amidase